jgi:phosphotriesterase-related protein
MPTVQTVLGEVNADQLGFTLTHEHIFIDLSYYWSGEPSEITKRNLYSQPVTLENRSEVVYHPWAFKDNTILDDIENAVNEVKAFRGNGGRTIIDVTATAPMGRDPQALRYVAAMTGANIVMSSGRYSEPSISDADKKMTAEDLERVILNEFINGAEDSGIKPGVIKVAFNDLTNEVERISLIAGARAQKKIGCALVCHSLIWSCDNHQALDILEQEGADLNKVILAHQDFTAEHWEYQDSLVKRGVFLEYDTFGCESAADPNDISNWFRSDGEKIRFVKKQIDLGNINHILLSGDMCLKIFFTKWGGWGYAHLPKNIVPRMKLSGITTDQIDQMTIENPQHVFGH